MVNSYSDTVTEVLGKVTRTTQTVNEELSNGKKQQTQTITETSRQLVNGVLKDIKTVTSIAADGKKTVKQTMETVREMANSVTSTFDTVVNGIATSTKTIKETLTDGTETTKKVITETFNKVVDGALVVVERVKNVAADGTEQTAETIKKASADSFSGLVKGWQDEADKGVLGTFGTLYKAVKSQDWLSVGQWVISTLYNGLAPETKLLIDDFGKNLIQQVNGFLGEGISQLANGAWDLGTQIFDGLTGGFGDVVSQFSGLGSTLLDIFGGLQGPLSAAALAISKGLQGGLISAFPEILASLGSLIGAIGGAVSYTHLTLPTKA